MAKTKEELIELKKEYEALNIKLKELTDAELKEVVGGGGDSKTVTIPLTLPQFSGNSYKITVYVDGQLQDSLTKTVDPIIEVVNISFNGSRGCISVTVKINDIPYKSYSVNFDNRSYYEIN